MLNKFLEVVLDVKGNIASRRFNKSFFEKNNRVELWNWFEEASSSFAGYDNRSIVFMLNKGLSYPPKCIVCGSDAKIQFYASGGQISDYCSVACSLVSDVRAKKISETKLAWSEDKKADVKEKRESTLMERHGRKTISYKGKPAHNRKQLPIEDIVYQYKVLNRSMVDIAQQNGCDYDTIRTRLTESGHKIKRKSNYSREEMEVKEFIESLGVSVVANTWEILNNKEIDIYVPSHNFAIELDGLVWHSLAHSSPEEKLKHLHKTEKCKELGIDLWHITDEQWHEKKEIVKSMIKHKLGKSSTKVYARKCKIKEIETKEARMFFYENHIQGFAPASKYIGLHSEEGLLFCMSFGKSRYNKKYDYELIRSAAKRDVCVIGGFSKVLKYFLKNNPGSLISYADRKYSSGEVYCKNGFTLVELTKPGYMWCLKRKSYSRLKFQKYKLKDIIKNYNPALSETENMFNNGYRQYWDCGQMVFELS